MSALGERLELAITFSSYEIQLSNLACNPHPSEGIDHPTCGNALDEMPAGRNLVWFETGQRPDTTVSVVLPKTFSDSKPCHLPA